MKEAREVSRAEQRRENIQMEGLVREITRRPMSLDPRGPVREWRLDR